MGTDLPELLRASLRQGLDDGCTGTLLAVSGGPDSMAMLHCYASLALPYPLVVACADHGLRPRSAEEVNMVAAECRKLSLPFVTTRLPVAQTLTGGSLENRCRRLRYQWLEEEMKKNGCSHLATAHNADDNGETVLLHLLRGSGLTGLQGILPKRRINAGWLIRPLINCPKADMINYCVTEGIAYAVDQTNQDTHFTRNRIRLELMPRLKEFNPALTQALLRCTAALRQDEEYLASQAEALLEDTADGTISLTALARAHPALRTRALREWFFRQTGIRLSAAQTEQLQALAAGETGRTELFRKYTVFSAQDRLHVWENTPPLPPTPIEPDAKVTTPAGTFTLRRERQTDPPDKDLLAADAGPWILRTRQPGDRIQAPGGRTRELKKRMNDLHIPPALRDRLILLCRENEVLWAEGMGCAHGRAAAPGKEGLRLCRHEDEKAEEK